MIHHFLPRFCATHVPTTRDVMVGFSASWNVIGLVSGLALISSDWLVRRRSTRLLKVVHLSEYGSELGGLCL